jgi:hypothetical protein
LLCEAENLETRLRSDSWRESNLRGAQQNNNNQQVAKEIGFKVAADGSFDPVKWLENSNYTVDSHAIQLITKINNQL